MPDRAEIDRVAPPEVFQGRVGQDLARPQIALAPQVELDEVRSKPVQSRDPVEDCQPLTDHLRPDTVARDHSDRRQFRLRNLGFASPPMKPCVLSLMACRHVRMAMNRL